VKIAIINSIVYRYAVGAGNAQGGAERFQWLLARALTKAGWSVVVGVRGALSPGQVEVIDGVQFVGMKRGQMIFSWWQFLDEQRPDWWFWRAADPIWGALLLVAKFKGVRSIFSAAYDTDVSPRIALFRRRRLWPLYAWGLNAVDRIFVQHREQFRNLSSELQKKAEIIPGLVVIPERVKARAERGGYIVWVASLRPHKRPDLLIELARITPEIHYVVCGGRSTFGTPPEFSEKISNRLSSLSNIEHLGEVPHSRVLDIIANAAALVSTSDMEGFPNIFLEAWASGTPVVSLCIDPDDLIKKKGLGFVSRSVERAASDVRNLLKSPETFETISRNARIHIEQVHSGAAVVTAFNIAVLNQEYIQRVPEGTSTN
jgi:glycosyltransferase involved in cell wall biosynthesis